MSSLRSNLLFSTLALMLMGLVRPVFNVAVSRVFGSEVNGHATALLSLAFLAALLPTAGLPTVLLLHVSRAIGEGRIERSRALARLCLQLGLCLAVIAGLGALAFGASGRGPKPVPLEAGLVAVSILAYSHSRLARNALLAQGLARVSVRADLLGVLSMGLALVFLASTRRPELALVLYAAPYLIYSLATAPRLMGQLRGGTLDPGDRGEVLRYTAFWLIATAASMATSELSVLLLHERVPETLVGQFGVVVSLLTPLGLAPRVLETPLIHELSQVVGSGDEQRQRDLTARSLHWLSVLTMPVSTAVAILSGPILFVVSHIETPDIADAFSMLVLSFSLEITQMPSSNLIAARARPWIMVLLTVVPLLITCVVWASWTTGGPLGVAFGLTVSHLTKAILVIGFVRVAYGVPVTVEPVKRVIALGLAIVATVMARRAIVSPWLLAAAFEVVFFALFLGTLKEIARSLLPRRTTGAGETEVSYRG